MVGVPVLIDTSVTLNLLATGISLAMLESLELDCFVCSAVIAETIYLRSDDPTQPREAVSIDPWLQSATVKVVTIDSSLEEELYVQFAADLDDGEAMSLAICRVRGYALATDDRKARRIAGQLASPGVPLVSTSQILQHWAVRTRAPQDELRRFVSAIELRARFIPPQDDPLRQWWISLRSDELL
ncbi:MAG: PIN domain-containing protein [Bryobacteraceae bacterium]